MARNTRRDRDDAAAPRPVGQSFWLLATVAIAALVLSSVGETLAIAEGAARPGAFTGQDLLDLAAAPSFGPSAPSVDPNAPSVDPNAPSIDLTAPATTPGFPATPTANPDGRTVGGPETDFDDTDPADGIIAEPNGPQRSGEAALATISYPWRELLPGWTISFLPETEGLYGLTLVPEQRIEIYVRSGQSTEFLAHVIAHEMGHAVDVSLNDGPDRRLWEAGRGIESATWWPGSGTTDFSTGAGDFAESFAAWQVGHQSFRSKLGGVPTVDQVNLLARLSAG